MFRVKFTNHILKTYINDWYKWTDERCVQILATAASSPLSSVMTRAIKFFLCIEERMEMDASRRAEEEKSAITVDLHLHSKKTKVCANMECC